MDAFQSELKRPNSFIEFVFPAERTTVDFKLNLGTLDTLFALLNASILILHLDSSIVPVELNIVSLVTIPIRKISSLLVTSAIYYKEPCCSIERTPVYYHSS